MAHKRNAHHKSSEQNSRPDSGEKPAIPVAPSGNSSSSPESSDGSSIPSWQPIFVICMIALGLLVLAAKAIGLF